MTNNVLHIGLDVGSTTVKTVVMDEKLNILFTSYERHFSDTKNTVCNCLNKLIEKYPNNEFVITLTGSGAMSVSEFLDLPFIQEVVSCKRAVEKYIPQTDVVIELGGEDAKIIYFGNSIEERMNGTCAGGTGAFLDQMAVLLDTDTQGLNEFAKKYKTIYPIASRCGVFAKTDIQPLLNEGAAKEDIAASIFQAVVNQTISGLACGRPIKGNVAFLGGPLSYLSELRTRFIETLNLHGNQIIVPEDAHLLVAKGAILDYMNAKPITIEKLKSKIEVLKQSHDRTNQPLKPLFMISEEYKEFKSRHNKAKIPSRDLKTYKGKCFVGIDAGSTTTKVVLIDEKSNLLYSLYAGNEGNPLKSVIKMMKELYSNLPNDAIICYSGVTRIWRKTNTNSFKYRAK
jgi:predicted CoA-substrate-specific enzyme activase